MLPIEAGCSLPGTLVAQCSLAPESRTVLCLLGAPATRLGLLTSDGWITVDGCSPFSPESLEDSLSSGHRSSSPSDSLELSGTSGGRHSSLSLSESLELTSTSGGGLSSPESVSLGFRLFGGGLHSLSV